MYSQMAFADQTVAPFGAGIIPCLQHFWSTWRS